MKLPDLGWNNHFAGHFLQFANDTFLPARVFRQDRQHFLVQSESGEYTATLLGRLAYNDSDSASRPAVGDWVAIDVFDQNQAVIHAVLPRQTVFTRKAAGELTSQQVIAANIDTAFIITGLDDDFNLRRLERYLVQTSSSGAEPVIILNKTDICPNVTEKLEDVTAIAPGVEVLTLSALSGIGVETIETMMEPGKTVVFLGSSGVGKSTLVNRLAGNEQQLTQAVRSDDSRGRHTTTRREIILLPRGGLIIDTPGLRELQLWGDEDDLNAAFPEVDSFAEHCHFRDCQHEQEPGCAVREAVASGNLHEDRYLSYLKLRRELHYLDSRKMESAQRSRKLKEKEFSRMVSRMKRENPKR